MTWDKEALKAEVEAFEDGSEISWREIAKKYNICNKSGQLAANGGQIAKDWLISEGVNVDRFTPKQERIECSTVRRKRRRGVGGEISLPTEVHPGILKQQLSEKLQSGEYSIGEMIVPKKVRIFVNSSKAKEVLNREYLIKH